LTDADTPALGSSRGCNGHRRPAGDRLTAAPASSAHAQAEAITGYSFTPAGAIVGSIVNGPDGALWFTWDTPQPRSGLARMTVGGGASDIPLPSTWGAPIGVSFLTSGAGSLWVEESHDNHDYIGRWNPSGSLIAEYQVPTAPYAITFGPDGNIWFSGGDEVTLSGGYIGRLTPAGVITTFAMPDPSHLVAQLTPGPDGAVWFSEAPGTNVGRITTTGGFTEFAIPGAPTDAGPGYWRQNITFGSDGALWMSVPLMQGIERMTTSGVFSHFAVESYGGPGAPYAITSAPDGTLWFTMPLSSTNPPPLVERITTSGVVTPYPIPASASLGQPTVITPGSDGALWFGAQNSVVARLDPAIAPDPHPSTTVQPQPSVPGTGALQTLPLGAALLSAGLMLLVVAASGRPRGAQRGCRRLRDGVRR
jgi:virginiamycin B lyase